MSEALLPYYDRELSYLRRLGAGFARSHPKIAGRLRLGPDASEDPHVERLIQAAAFLNARTRHKLDDDFPELTDALLGSLYPHYQLPIPSMAVVQFEADAAQEMTAGHTVPRGTEIDTEPIDGEPCRFRTAYPVTLWPLHVDGAALARPPFSAPTPPPGTESVLLIEFAGPADLSTLEPESLRLFVNGQNQHVFPLYELLFNNCLGVALAASPHDPEPLMLGPDALRPVGFGRDEGLLPYSPRSFIGYRLLTEFFAFPAKFLFADVAGWDRRQWQRLAKRLAGRLQLFIYLDRAAPDLEPNVTADTFRLGCTPVVNLYRQRAEPVALTHTETEYRVVPDARRPLAHEVYSVDAVSAVGSDGEETAFAPFFSTGHAAEGPARYWHSVRRPAPADDERPDAGSEVYVSLVDLTFRADAPSDATLAVETTCLNRDLPHRLPFGGGQPALHPSEADARVAAVRCLTPPTPTLRPALKQGALWRLVSHLTLNHLSLEGGADGAEALREILKLYDFTDSDQTRSMTAGVTRVESRRTVARAGGGEAVCRGTDVTVTFDPKRFAGSGLFLFAGVLERFLGLYCTINSFTRLTAVVEGQTGELRRWPPRMGEHALV